MRRGGVAVLVLVVLAAVLPASADAATTVGSSLRQRANLYVRCAGNCTAVESARPSGAGLTIPSDGVVTRWRVRAATLGQVRFRILRPESDGGYSSIAVADPVRLDRAHQPGQDVLYEFPTRLTVQAGDVIALDRDAKAGGVYHSYGTNTSYAVATFSPALKDDATDKQPDSNATGRELLLNADVEKDEDGDGFGDESQDNCPTIANDQTDRPCAPAAGPTTPTEPQPQGPTSQTIDTGQPHGGGSAGPPVAGERPVNRTVRGHSRKRRARSSPPGGGDPTRGHNRRPSARKGPPKPTRPDSNRHGSQPNARPAPKSRRRPTSEHAPTTRRPKPPSVERNPARPHNNSPSERPKPSPRKRPAQRHNGTTHRTAPQPKPTPGWQHH